MNSSLNRFCSLCAMTKTKDGKVPIVFAQWIVPTNTGQIMCATNMQTVCEKHLEELNVEKYTNRCRPISEYDDLRKR